MTINIIHLIMHITPVIDLKDGLVVSAQLGQRQSYQGLISPLCTTSKLEDCISGFLTLYKFKTIYIADLNAITKTGSNQTLIDKVICENKAIEFWIDNGMTAQSLSEYFPTHYKSIIGSESQKHNQLHLLENCATDYLLSLDFFPDSGYSGPAEILKTPALWPEKIIIMTLDRVGKNIGPDFKKLQKYSQTYPEKEIIAAGGIRHQDDLINLKKIGVNHALISSALHSGIISDKTIKDFGSL